MVGNSIFANKDEVINFGNQLDTNINQLKDNVSKIQAECDSLLSYVHGSLSSQVAGCRDKVSAVGAKVVGNAVQASMFLQERMKEYGMTEDEAYQMLEKSIDNLGQVSSAIKGGFLTSLSGSVNQWIGQRMDNGENGCVEAVTKMGASGSAFLKNELNKGVVNVGKLVEDAKNSGVPVVDFYPNSLNTGDVIVYDNGSHVVMYSGQGTGYYGNSSSQMQIVHGDNYNYMDGMVPTQIIKTSGGWKP